MKNLDSYLSSISFLITIIHLISLHAELHQPETTAIQSCNDEPILQIISNLSSNHLKNITNSLDESNYYNRYKHAFYLESSVGSEPTLSSTSRLTLQCHCTIPIDVRVQSLMPSRIQNLERFIIKIQKQKQKQKWSRSLLDNNDTLWENLTKQATSENNDDFHTSEETFCHVTRFEISLNDYRTTGEYICHKIINDRDNDNIIDYSRIEPHSTSILIFTNGVTNGILLETDSVVENILPDQGGLIYIPCIFTNPFAKINLFRQYIIDGDENNIDSTSQVEYSIGYGFKVDVTSEHYHSSYLCQYETFEERIFLHEKFHKNETHFLIHPKRTYLTSSDIVQLSANSISNSSSSNPLHQIVFSCSSNNEIYFDLKFSNVTFVTDVNYYNFTSPATFYQYFIKVTITFDPKLLIQSSENGNENIDQIKVQCLHRNYETKDVDVLHTWIYNCKVAEYSKFIFESSQRFTCGLKSTVFPSLIAVACDNTINCDIAAQNEARVWHDYESYPFEKFVIGRAIETTNLFGVRISSSPSIRKDLDHGLTFCQDVSLYEKEGDNFEPLYFFRGFSGTLFDYTKDKQLFAIDEVLRLHEIQETKIYEGQSIILKCQAITHIFAQPLYIYFEYENGSLLNTNEILGTNQTINKIKNGWLELQVQTKVLSTGVKKIVCSGSKWQTSSSSNVSQIIHVEGGEFPRIYDQENIDTKLVSLGTKNHELKCEAYGEPIPTIAWLKDGNDLPIFLHVEETINHTLKQIISIIRIPEIDEHLHFGSYTCKAFNVKGFIEKEYFIKSKIITGKSNLASIIIGSTLGSLLILLLMLLIVLWRRMKKRPLLTKEDLAEFSVGNPKLVPAPNNNYERESRRGTLSASTFIDPIDIVNMCYNKRYEIPWADLAIDRDNELGSGEFGVVWKGKLWKGVNSVSTPIAIKSFKKSAEREYIKASLLEIKLMSYIGKHKHILEFIGAVTVNARQGKLFIVLEFCELGSLEKYLRNFRSNFINQLDPSSGGERIYENFREDVQAVLQPESSPLTTTDLIQMSYQIAQGMEFLSKKKVVHADLACRNILLTAERVVKICDFGLARQLYRCAEYSKTTKSPLPWRWMALESLVDLTFSTKSDVWSFGVTLWEIFSLAQTPYAGLSWTSEFVNDLSQGLRIGKSQYCPTNIYHLMTTCWENNPAQRPTFSTLVSIFEEFDEVKKEGLNEGKTKSTEFEPGPGVQMRRQPSLLSSIASYQNG